MTEACLNQKNLKCLDGCRQIATESLGFYENLYDQIEVSSDRDIVGRAMAQKKTFIGALVAIFNNHEFTVTEIKLQSHTKDYRKILHDGELATHLEQEDAFLESLKICMKSIDDETTSELIEHHFKAAEIALVAIKESSLKI